VRAAPPADPRPDAHRIWTASWPIDLCRSLAPLQRGRFDPCQRRVSDRTIWRTARPADGPVLARLVQLDEHRIACDAWGAGAAWFANRLPQLLGEDDDADAFAPAGHDLLARLHRAAPWLRMPRTGRVFEAMVGAVLEQRVTVREALDARSRLIRRHGSLPPASPKGMPEELRVMPAPTAWLDIPSWDYHRAGVDVKRAATLRRCALVASRLDETTAMDRADAVRRLRSVRGIGVWTVAETRQRSCGDADLVSYGDVHLPRFVGYALTGEPADDARMEELLEPWRGHRHRVVRLLQLGASLGAVQSPPSIPRARPRAHLGF
jgi:3-methyladenine DNA glycosylase/8-oxoguanine DNA glycosylase